MRILLVVWSLSKEMGGRERAGATLANAMVERGHECTIVTDDHKHRPSLYPLNDKVELIYMDIFDNSYSRQKLRKQIIAKNPDVVMTMCSSREIIVWPAIVKGTGIPLIISERVDPTVAEKDCWKSRKERIAVLSVADIIHIQMNGYRNYYPEFLQNRVVVIPNPVTPAKLLANPTGERDSKILIHVGRISEKQKKQRLLARAFALVAQDFPDWSLHYWGGGALCARDDLQKEISRIGLEDRIFVCWTTNNIAEKLSNAQVFAFPSKMEGCPNALLEAQAHGLPAFGFKHCGGTNEIIINGKNGLLFDELNEESIAKAIYTLLSDEQLRISMGQAAFENSKKYSPKKIFDLYENMFSEIVSKKRIPRFERPIETDEEKIYRDYMNFLCTRENIHKTQSPKCRNKLFAIAEDTRKRISRSYIRPIRDSLRKFRGKQVKK